MIKTLNDLAESALDPKSLEVIVVDGGSKDDTLQAFSAQPWLAFGSLKATSSEGGRGPAFNTGIELASGDIIVLLHADCRLPSKFDQTLKNTFLDPQILLSAFQFSVSDQQGSVHDRSTTRKLRQLEFTANLRSKYLWLPYGDQALAMRKQDLQAYFAGRLPNTKMLEDLVFVRQVRNFALDNNKRIAIIPHAAHSSPRRWLAKGIRKNSALNWLFVTAYVWGGKSPEQIYDWYYA